MVGTKSFAALTGCLIILVAGSVSSAGVLDGHPAAYDNDLGPGPGGAWTGSAPFTDGDQLSGYVDYAVFTAAAFNNPVNGLSPLGYAPADSLVYAYQLFNTGNALVSAEIVGVSNPASSIGQFDIGDISAHTMTLDGGVAQWDFGGILTGQSSWGLAFSSPNIPEMGTSVTIDSGSLAFADVPTPSATQIPEPASILLLVGSSLMLFAVRRRG